MELTTQPCDYTCNSSPCVLGSSIRILAVVLHYELSFCFLSPQADLFLAHIKKQRLFHPSGPWHAKEALSKYILHPGMENLVSVEIFSKWTETQSFHINRYCIK